MCGKGTQTTTSSNSPPAQVLQQYGDVTGLANNVAKTPYQPYTGTLTAPINSTQSAATGDIAAQYGNLGSIASGLNSTSSAAGGVGSNYAGLATGALGAEQGVAGQEGDLSNQSLATSSPIGDDLLNLSGGALSSASPYVGELGTLGGAAAGYAGGVGNNLAGLSAQVGSLAPGAITNAYNTGDTVGNAANAALASGGKYANSVGALAPGALASAYGTGANLLGLSAGALGSGNAYAGSEGSLAPQSLGAAQGVAGQIGQSAGTLGGLASTTGQTAQGIGSLGGVYQPYYNEAQSYTAAGANALAPQNYAANVAGYMSPYTQDVVNTTQGQFNNSNAIQASGALSSAIASGNAFGGDRAGVDEAVLAGQQQTAQAPVIAGLENAGYTNAQGELNTAASNALTAGAQFGALGTGAQAASLAAPEAQIAGYTAAGNLAASQAGALASQAGVLNQGYQTAGNLTATAGNLANQGYGTAGTLATAQGNLVNQGYGTSANIGASAGNLANQGEATAGSLAASQGNLINQGYETAGNLGTAAGSLAAEQAGVVNTGLSTAGGLATNQGNLVNQAYGTSGNLASAAGNELNTGISTGLAATNAQGQTLNQGYTTAGNLNAGELSALGVQNQTSALQQANNQLGTSDANSLLAAGTLSQQTQQAQDTAAYQQYENAIAFPYQQVGWLGNISEGIGTNSGGTTTTQQPAPFFSDERLKEDKSIIGKTKDGQNLYRFRYKGSPDWHIGLIAQEVQKKHPSAVSSHGGLLAVDYKAATDAAAKRGKFATGGVSSFPGMDVASLIPNTNPLVTGNSQDGMPGRSGGSQTPSPAQQAVQALGDANAAISFGKNVGPAVSGIGGALGFGAPAALPGATLAAAAPVAADVGGSLAPAVAGALLFRRGGMAPQFLLRRAVGGRALARYVEGGPVSDPFADNLYGIPPQGGGAAPQGNLGSPAVAPSPSPAPYMPMVPTMGLSPADNPATVVNASFGAPPQGNAPASPPGPSGTLAAQPSAASAAAPALPATPLETLASAPMTPAPSGTLAGTVGAPMPAAPSLSYGPVTGASPATSGNLSGAASSGAPSYPNTPEGHTAFIRDYSMARAANASNPSYDPALTQAIAGAEGNNSQGWRTPNLASAVDIDKKTGQPFSYSDFQLNIRDGLGVDALKAGVDPRDPNQWQQAAKFAIDYQADHNYAPWKGDAALEASRAGSPLPSSGPAMGGGAAAGAPTASGTLAGPRAPAANDNDKGLFGTGIKVAPEMQQALLAGLFGMLGSPSHYLAGAIGQGGLAAMGQYSKATQLAQQEQQVQSNAANTQSEIAQRPQDIAIRKQLADAEAARVRQEGTYQQGTLANQTALTRAEALKAGVIMTPAGPVDLRTGQPIAIGPQMPSIAPPTTGAPAAAGAPAGSGPASAPAGQPGYSPFRVPVPVAPPPPNYYGEGPNKVYMGQAEKDIEGATSAGQAAMATKSLLGELQNDYSAIPSDAFLQSGAGAAWRQKFAKDVNSVSSVFGVKPSDLPFDPNQVGSNEQVNKIVTQLGVSVNKGLGREPGYILDKLTAMQPGLENTPQGNALIMAGQRATAQSAQDYADFIQQYFAQNGHTVGAQAAFNKAMPENRYVQEAQTIASIPQNHIAALRANPGLAQAFDQQYGTGMSRYYLQ